MATVPTRVMRVEVGPPGRMGRSWDGLRIRCECKKTTRPHPNKATIEIHNLNADSRGYLEQEGLAVIVYAGKDEQPPLLFVGDIDSVQHELQGTTWVSTIQARDGARAWRSVGSESWRGASSSSDLFRRIAESMGLGLFVAEDVPEVDFGDGFTVRGKARRVLSAVVSEIGAEYSIQNGQLVVGLSKAAISTRAKLIKAGTGLKGSPERTKKGARVSIELDATVKAGDLVKLESRALEGVFVVRSVSHSADSHADAETALELRRR